MNANSPKRRKLLEPSQNGELIGRKKDERRKRRAKESQLRIDAMKEDIATVISCESCSCGCLDVCAFVIARMHGFFNW